MNEIEPVQAPNCIMSHLDLKCEEGLPIARIARFDGDRRAALCYTFDDNLRDQYRLAIPMLNECNFKGTFFVIPGLTLECPLLAEQRQITCDNDRWGGIAWPELQEMSEQGHEIGNHTWSHPDLTKASHQTVEAELQRAFDLITKKIGHPPLTAAFPFNAFNPAILKLTLLKHIACRTRQLGFDGNTTSEMLSIWLRQLVERGEEGIAMIHGIEEGFGALKCRELLSRHFIEVKSWAHLVWVETFANLKRYELEREHSRVFISGGRGCISCQVECSLSSTVFDFPLTVVLQTQGVKAAQARRGGQDVPVIITSQSMMVRVVPGGPPVEIFWQ
jgi:peptidoglycan/xylan/chitin deacetylase (PgdA/CDA1 family)